MKAICEYDKDDVKQLICRDILAKFGTKVEAKQITLNLSKQDGSIVYEVELHTSKGTSNV